MSDRSVVNALKEKVGSPFHYVFEGDRCTEIDLTSQATLFSGLIRRRDDEDKFAIMSLIGELPGLRSLNLRRNKIRRLPPNFTNLTQLEYLNLGSNYLGAIPEQIRGIVGLKSLHLANNDLTELPAWFGELECLEYLALHKNLNLRKIGPVASLKALKALNLYFVNLGALPDSIYELTNLETLTTWNVSSWADKLAQLEKLEFLTICGSISMRDLPPAITSLRRLRMVRWYQNGLERLPSDIGELDRLEQISLYQNNLTDLPESMAELHCLRKLNLGWNRFTELPSLLQKLRSLEWLAVFANPACTTGAIPVFPDQTHVLVEWPFTTVAQLAPRPSTRPSSPP